MYKRIISLKEILERKSVFLFGPRQTGKSTWLKSQFPEALYINLLSKKTNDDYQNRTDALASDIRIFQKEGRSNLIIIDEVQKIPELLDEVHHQIEENKKLRFILTGSSARKLKRSGANLLGGRASWKDFFPLVYPEIQEELSSIEGIERRMNIGGLPSIYTSTKNSDDLDDYIQMYLNEEVRAEGLVRNYESFHRFLTVAALANAKQINFTEIGSDAQVPPRTVHDYFQILEDTLIGFLLPAFVETTKRKAMTSAKFYLFDTGLANALLGRNKVVRGTPEFGDLFEHYIISEVRAYISYFNSKAKMYYWRSTSKIEIDLILQKENRIIAIEIKGKAKISAKDYKAFRAFSEEFPKARKIVVGTEVRKALTEEQVEIYSVFDFLELLWNHKIV